MDKRTRPHVDALRAHVEQLIQNGNRIVLSAWHAIELSRATDIDQIRSSLRFIDDLQPLWLSNPIYVKREEIKSFLASEWDEPDLQGHDNPAFNTSVSQMWSTYSNDVFVGESLGDTVLAMNNQPDSCQPIEDALSNCPNAILTGRHAIQTGISKQVQHIVDQEYFESLVPQKLDNAVGYLMDNTDSALAVCPSVAIEEYMTRIRLNEDFIPKQSDAPDLQHAIVGLAYCDYFISDDKMLVAHSNRSVNQAGLTCTVDRNLLNVPTGS